MANVAKTSVEEDKILEEPLFERFKECTSLPALAPLPSKILKLCRKEEACSDKLAALIRQDPSIVARVLQVANSGFYGGSRHNILNISQAVTLLGINTLVSLVTTFCLQRLLNDMFESDHSGFDHIQFWKRSILASFAGRAIAQWAHIPDTEVVYLGALLQDIGLLALNETLPGVVPAMAKEAEGCHVRLQVLEHERFGLDHAEMGSWLAEIWELPDELQLAIQGSHDPNFLVLSPHMIPTVSCVALSSWVAEIWSRPDTEQAVQDAARQAEMFMNMTRQEMQTILNRVYEDLPQMAGFLQIKLGDSAEMKQIFQIAQDTLTQDPASQDQEE